MAFKSIGTLAGEVLVKAKAARANQVAHEIGPSHNRAKRKAGSGAQSNREEDSAHLLTGGVSREHGNEVTRASGDQHASGSHEGVTAGRTPYRATTLQSLNIMLRDRRAVVSGRAPRPAARLSLVTVDGVLVAPAAHG